MRSVLVIAVFVVLAAQAVEFEQPLISGSVIMDFMSYSEDSAYSSNGQYVAVCNRLQARKFSLGISGSINTFVEYEAELGISGCSGPSLRVSVKEAGVYFTPGETRFGVGMTHVKRGFELGSDCGHTLTAEKPVFRKAVSPNCHPLGFIAETEFSLGTAGFIEAELFYGNGGTGTLKDEHDINAALFYHTPFQGLAAGGFYNSIEMEVNPENDGSESGTRYGFGLDYSSSGLLVRCEYFMIDGLLPGMRPVGCSMAAEEVENTGVIAETGYLFPLSSESISSVTPYFQYQRWDRFSNSESGDYKFSWIVAGVKANMGSSNCYVTAEYQTPSATPEEQRKDSSVFRLRLGVNY
ncbi:MAG: hypothetical protein KAR40_03915 [Candidatus Sabulitectum sp.]|nr:hypothetical protein [Candidatus Sabulitectum sp.]